jgi:hypothetical protein
MRKNVGVREHSAESFDYLFAASHTHKPIVNNRDFHKTSTVFDSAHTRLRSQARSGLL